MVALLIKKEHTQNTVSLLIIGDEQSALKYNKLYKLL